MWCLSSCLLLVAVSYIPAQLYWCCASSSCIHIIIPINDVLLNSWIHCYRCKQSPNANTSWFLNFNNNSILLWIQQFLVQYKYIAFDSFIGTWWCDVIVLVLSFFFLFPSHYFWLVSFVFRHSHSTFRRRQGRRGKRKSITHRRLVVAAVPQTVQIYWDRM